MTANNNITDLTYELAFELFNVDFDLGILRWKSRDKKHFKNNRSLKAFNTLYLNKIAGSIYYTETNKYYKVKYKNKRYGVHRIIYLMRYGFWPYQIDHINHNGLDNRIINLRNVSNIENGRNQRLYKTNTSGICGVYWNKSRSKYVSSITVNGSQIFLGHYDNIIDAVATRKREEIKYGFHKNHGEKNERF